jgi:hypothetical protein
VDREKLYPLPEEKFGKWGTVYDLFTTWNADEILDRLRAAHVNVNVIDIGFWGVDETNVGAARCAAGAKKGG